MVFFRCLKLFIFFKNYSLFGKNLYDKIIKCFEVDILCKILKNVVEDEI